MYIQKSSHIELGGQKKYTPNSYVNNLTKMPYPTNPAPQNSHLNKVISKQIILSTHQIPGKKSPSKYSNIQSNQTSRKGSILTNENSFIQIVDSSIQTPSSISNRVYRAKSPLRQAQNITHQRKLVRVNFVSTSPNTEKNSINKKQAKVTPNKMITCGQTKEEALERKLKVLQGRIGQLHKQKHQLVGRLNEQNRRIYHQNTSLKLKVTELMKKIDKSSQNIDTRNDQQEIQEVVRKYETTIKQLTQKNNSYCEQYQQVVNQLKQSNHDFKKLQAENKNISKKLQQQQTNYNSLHSEYQQVIQQKQSLLSVKQKYQKDMQQIQKSITQNSKYNSIILQQYQAKLQQYKQAYDKNQQIIQQLSHQLQEHYNSQNTYPSSDQIMMRESQTGEGELMAQCKKLQNNFLSALDEKDQVIANLQNTNQEIKAELTNKDQIIQQITLINEEQAKRLEEIGSLLQHYTDKIKELESKYEQLCRSNQQQRQQKTNSKIQSSAQKCKKCDELTKTIFRLNSHLNKKS